MSFLSSLPGLSSLAGAGGAAAGAAGAASAANPMASGLGHLLGADPSHISSIADRIGTGMNSIAAAGGAAPGYAAPQQPAAQAAPQMSNAMQLLDPNVLKALSAVFGNPSSGYSR